LQSAFWYAANVPSAIRRAENGAEFVNTATALLGTVGGRFQVIDGEREARLSWRAVRAAFPSLTGPRTVVDMGGGSTEILVGDHEPEAVVSLPIGSVRLNERLIKHDPPTAEERLALLEAVDAALEAAPPLRGTIVGIAGTVTTLMAMHLGLRQYDADQVHGASLSVEALAELVLALGAETVAERKRRAGLDPKRADVIYAGAVILQRILHRARAPLCLVSDRGIRWGLAYEAAGLGG
jgi:exopolyphosphatase/guanosine-5'-triphosphate,3'-diphosphate pyrophosphatase